MRVNVVKRGDTGTYRVKVVGRDDGGRWTTKWVKGSFPNEAAAITKQKELEAAMNAGGMEELDNSTLGGYLTEWLRTRRAMGGIGPSSERPYFNALLRVQREAGSLALATLTFRDVQKVYSRIAEQYGLVAANYTHKIFKMAIRDAVRDGRIMLDPMARVEPPRAKPAKKHRTLDTADIRAILAAAGNSEVGRALRLLAATGMRIGELCALKWGDFDFVKRQIRIERTATRTMADRVFIKEPKTAAGKRVIAVDGDTMGEFAGGRMKANDGDFVFSQQSPNAMGQRLQRVFVQAGFGDFSPHDLRHAHATYLLRASKNAKAVSQRLGHADVRITLSTYAHVMDGDDEALATQMEGMFK